MLSPCAIEKKERLLRCNIVQMARAAGVAHAEPFSSRLSKDSYAIRCFHTNLLRDDTPLGTAAIPMQ